MRTVYVALVAATIVALTFVACEDVLGINGQYQSVPAAFCNEANNVCGKEQGWAGFDETNCERSIASVPVSAGDFVRCSQADGGCPAFIACLDTAIGGCVISSTTLDMPCSSMNAGVCCAHACSSDAGVGLCN